MGALRQHYDKDERVRLDKTFQNTSIVIVVSQTPQKLYTRVKSEEGGEEWDVMTNRLDKLEE